MMNGGSGDGHPHLLRTTAVGEQKFLSLSLPLIQSRGREERRLRGSLTLTGFTPLLGRGEDLRNPA